MYLDKDKFQSKLSGPDYYTVLSWLHELLPNTCYIEIGVREGRSLALAASSRLSIGVDPDPRIVVMPPQATVVKSTSDEFFSSAYPQDLLANQTFSLAFIDGMHLFDQVLRDFANLEKLGHRNSVVAIHDCIPQHEATSGRERNTAFFSGDVWKAVVCLKEWREDVSIAMVPTPPTGLCLVTNLDPNSTVLSANWATILSQYGLLTFGDYERHYYKAIDSIENSVSGVTSWLNQTGLG